MNVYAFAFCIAQFLVVWLADFQILHKGLSSENLMIGLEFYLKLTGMHTDNSSRHKEPAMRQLKRTASVSRCVLAVVGAFTYMARQ